MTGSRPSSRMDVSLRDSNGAVAVVVELCLASNPNAAHKHLQLFAYGHNAMLEARSPPKTVLPVLGLTAEASDFAFKFRVYGMLPLAGQHGHTPPLAEVPVLRSEPHRLAHLLRVLYGWAQHRQSLCGQTNGALPVRLSDTCVAVPKPGVRRTVPGSGWVVRKEFAYMYRTEPVDATVRRTAQAFDQLWGLGEQGEPTAAAAAAGKAEASGRDEPDAGARPLAVPQGYVRLAHGHTADGWRRISELAPNGKAPSDGGPAGQAMMDDMAMLRGHVHVDYEAVQYDWTPGKPRHGLRVDHLRSLMRAIDYVHARNIVHGDIRWSNIILGQRGTVTLIDFDMSGPADERRYVYNYNPNICCDGLRHDTAEACSPLQPVHDVLAAVALVVQAHDYELAAGDWGELVSQCQKWAQRRAFGEDEEAMLANWLVDQAPCRAHWAGRHAQQTQFSGSGSPTKAEGGRRDASGSHSGSQLSGSRASAASASSSPSTSGSGRGRLRQSPNRSLASDPARVERVKHWGDHFATFGREAEQW